MPLTFVDLHVPLCEAEDEELAPAVLQQGGLIPLRELVVRRDALGPAHAHEEQLGGRLVDVLRRREEHGGRSRRVEAAATTTGRGRRRGRRGGGYRHRSQGSAAMKKMRVEGDESRGRWDATKREKMKYGRCAGIGHPHNFKIFFTPSP